MTPERELANWEQARDRYLETGTLADKHWMDTSLTPRVAGILSAREDAEIEAARAAREAAARIEKIKRDGLRHNVLFALFMLGAILLAGFLPALIAVLI
jgi:hypothetical protein